MVLLFVIMIVDLGGEVLILIVLVVATLLCGGRHDDGLKIFPAEIHNLTPRAKFTTTQIKLYNNALIVQTLILNYHRR